MFVFNNPAACSQASVNYSHNRQQSQRGNVSQEKRQSLAKEGETGNMGQLSKLVSRLIGQLGNDERRNGKKFCCHANISQNPAKPGCSSDPVTPGEPDPNAPPTVNTINGSRALKSYLSTAYSSAATIQDMDGNGKIGAGDRIDYGVGEDAFRYLTIDQALADTLNQYNAMTEPVAIPDPGAQGLIEPNSTLKSYLDSYYPTNAEIHEVNGDGNISVGDRIIYQNGQGISQRRVIDQALADKLNKLNT